MSKFLNNASLYGSATLYSMIIGLVSYPILTRLFDVADYGTLGLVSATVPLLVGLGKLGLQHASVRFYSDVNRANSRWNTAQLYSTTYLSMLISALTICAIISLALPLINNRLAHFDFPIELLMIAAYLMIARVLESASLNLFQAKEQANYHSLYIMLKRTLVLITTLAILLLVRVDLKLYFLSLLLIEATLIAGLMFWSVPIRDIRARNFDPALLSAMMMYGIPMLGTEVSTSLIGVTDRYVIAALLGTESVGQFTSAFTLVEYGQAIITAALATSALPMFLRIDATQGRAAAGAFISSAMRIYVIAAIPLVVFMGSAGESMLIFLASDKYADGAIIMPWASAGLGVHGAFVLVASGLYLNKRSGLMFALLLGTAIANVALSLTLVPFLGIEGAAASTLICYLFCGFSAYYFSRKVLILELPWNAALHAMIAAAAMLGVLSLISVSQPLIDLLLKSGAGLCTYVAIIMALNKEVRVILIRRVQSISFTEKLVRKAP